jgi:transglutaminase-like putative cysteine protease
MRSSVIDSRRSVEKERYQTPQAVPTPTRKPLTSRPPSKHIVLLKKQALPLAPTEGWLSLLLLAVAVYSVIFAIVDAHWVSHSEMLLWCPIVGLLLGLLVAKLSRLSKAILHLGACLLGHWFSVWLTAAIAFHINGLFLLSSIRAILVGGLTPTTIPNAEAIFFFYLAFLCFFLSYFGCWLVYRAHLPWLVALVYCSIMLVDLNSYTRQDLSYLLIILLASLILLIARVQLAVQVLQWTNEGLYTNQKWLRSLAMRCMQIASALMLITLAVTLLLPIQGQSTQGEVFWNQLGNAWNNVSNGNISWKNPASLLQPYQPPANFFSNQLTITGSVHLPMGEVLEYTSASGPHYLEGFTLDQFDGHTWSTLTSWANGKQFTSNAPLPIDVARNDDTSITTSITIKQVPESSKPYLFAPAQPISFDVPTAVYSNGTATAWTQQGSLTNGEQYRVTSLLIPTDTRMLMSIPLPADNPGLWQSGTNASIMNVYYKQIPHDLSPNVLKLAHQWTAGAANTYSALKGIEQHLSNQNVFTYAIDNPPIPANTDVVDWLLQTHRGYCTYYASAMIVMARQLGIPARMVNGFSQGHYDVQHHTWIVDGSDAHSWVQAYFPGFGWVNFDPTPGFSLANVKQPQPTPSPTVPPQPTKPVPTAQPKPAPTPTKPQSPNPPGKYPPAPTHPAQITTLNMNILVNLSLLALFASLLLFSFALVVHWWRNLYATSSRVSGLFWRLCWLASWVGLSPRASQTPYEYSQVLVQHFPQRARALRHLTELFVRDRWGTPHQVPQGLEEEHAVQLWNHVRGMFLEGMLRKVKR